MVCSDWVLVVFRMRVRVRGVMVRIGLCIEIFFRRVFGKGVRLELRWWG